MFSVFAPNAARRSCATLQVRPFVVAGTKARCPHNTTQFFFHNATARTTLFSIPYFSDGGCSAAALTTPRRFGSGVSRKSRTGMSRGRGTGKDKGASASAQIPTRVAAPQAVATGALDETSTSHRSITDKNNVKSGRRTAQLNVADEEEGIGKGTELISPLTKRTQRRSNKSGGSMKGEERAATYLRAVNDTDNAGEDELEGAETPAGDPTAPTQEDEDDSFENALEMKEEDETRVDGVEETNDVLTGESLLGLEEAIKRKRSTQASTTVKARRAGEYVADTDVEDDSVGDSDAASSSHQADSEDSGLPSMATSEQGEEIANKLLAAAFPDLAAEYSAAGPEANKVPVADVKVDSADIAAWRCPVCNKTWRCGVFVRCVLKNECPHCTAAREVAMAAVRPDLLQLWDRNRNNPFLKPETISADSKEVVYWSCPTCRESYTARVRDRVQEKAHCPSCALLRASASDALGARTNALQQEWHPLKNGDLRLDQLAPTDRKTKVWWLCASCGHEWEASLATRLSNSNRSRGRVCPACHGQGTMEVF